MSAASLVSPPSPSLHHDIRAGTQPSKRDKDHAHKWIDGTRPLEGRFDYRYNIYPNGNPPKWTVDTVPDDVKTRPRKSFSQSFHVYKSHANKSLRFSDRSRMFGPGASGRINRKLEAQAETSSGTDISSSMLGLMPQHDPSIVGSTKTVLRAPDDDEMRHPLEENTPSPAKKSHAVGLGSLIEKAEQEFLSKQTELMVREDYEVLDAEGQTVVLKAEKKRKNSPKQKAAKAAAELIEEDDGFELI